MLPLISAITGVVGEIIDKTFTTDKDRADAHYKLTELIQTGQLKELETRLSAIIAEAQSPDPFTSRARPSFMYVFYVVILSLVIIAPLVGVFYPTQMTNFFSNVDLGFKAIPSELWATFTAGYLGYSYFRTDEKKKGVTK